MYTHKWNNKAIYFGILAAIFALYVLVLVLAAIFFLLQKK